LVCGVSFNDTVQLAKQCIGDSWFLVDVEYCVHDCSKSMFCLFAH
jgi:hypothetical protein